MPEEEATHFMGLLILGLILVGIIIFILILISPHDNPLAYFFKVVLPKIILGI